MIAGVISILTYIVLRSRKGQKFFFLTNKAKFAHHFLLIDSPIYIYILFFCNQHKKIVRFGIEKTTIFLGLIK